MTFDFLRRLQGEVALAERAATVARGAERERCARLAEAYGQRQLAAIIRSPTCPDCHGVGYDASGQTCACQENPSF
jgi:hypothetical protein